MSTKMNKRNDDKIKNEQNSENTIYVGNKSDDGLDVFSTKTYHYNLPESQIAQTPIEPRDHSKMLVYDRQEGSITHKHFFDVIDYLDAGDVLVVNNTRVIPARLIGKKVETGAKAEVFLLEKKTENVWKVLLKPAHKLKVGTEISFCDDFTCKVTNYK